MHLPWDSVAERERQIVEIVKTISERQCDYIYIVGDFNCDDSSDAEVECTLNFRENPRFRNNTIETNVRFDRILLRNTYPCGMFFKE